jgi:pimeloyl-ACP methyl ester carboxylesterase
MRRWGIGAGAIVLVLLLVLAAGGWYYSDQLLPAAVAGDVATDVEVVAVDGDTVRLRPQDAPDWDVDDLHSDLVVGYQHLTGYLQLYDSPVATDGDEVTRRFDVVAGTPPAAGDRGDVQTTAFPDDPAVLDRPVEQVVASGPLGDLPGWVFPGEGEQADDWVVLVHGRGATRSETLRGVEAAVGDSGRSALSVTYRNDPEAPASPDGFGHFGDTEWLDLQAWLGWLDETAAPRSITLYGYSQGGSVVASCLRRCEDTSRVTGTVLDSPLLSMGATLELQAADRGIPSPLIGPLLTATKAVSAVRGGPDFARLEHVDALAELDLPILLFHGRADGTVPFAPSAALAEADPEQVTFLPYEGRHVRGWNEDPSGYAEAVGEFLASTS